jgi:hypothetical protein
VDDHLTGPQLDVLAGPDPGIGPLPVDLDGADGARDLADRAGQGRDGRGERVRVERPGAGPLEDIPLGVVGHRRLAEPYRRGIRLVTADEVGEQPGSRPQAEDEHAGGHRVEGARMADLAGAGEPADPADDIV